MIILKSPDGTVEFRGFVFEMLEYTAKALNIRKVDLINCATLLYMGKFKFICLSHMQL